MVMKKILQVFCCTKEEYLSGKYNRDIWESSVVIDIESGKILKDRYATN